MLLRRVFRWLRRTTDEDLREELEFHRARLQADLEADGLSADAAHLASRRAMGNITLAREDSRDVWVARWLDALARDVRYGIRTVRREPTFALGAILTLALGIATTTTVFSVVDAELWKRLPYPHPDRLVAVYWQGPGSNSPYEPISGADLEDCRAQVTAFDALAGAGRVWRAVLRRKTSESVLAQPVTSNYFSTLGARFQLGRDLNQSDERDGRAAVLTDAAWQRVFDADPAVLGRTVTIDERDVVIVGVLARAASSPDAADFSIVIDPTSGEYRDRSARSIMNVIGRLRAGSTFMAAQAELQTVMDRIARTSSGGRADHTIHVEDLRASISGFYWRPLYFFMGASLIVLFLSCANVANLLLARALRRRREFALRGALGGGRGAIARQLLLEGAVVALPAGAFALLLTHWALAFFSSRIPSDYLERGTHIPVDARVALFALTVVAVTTLAFGLVPSFFARRVSLNVILGEGGRSAGRGPATLRAQAGLLLGQIALTLVLLAGAGIFLRSFVLLTHTRLGFEPRDRATVRVSLSGPRYATDTDVSRYADALLTAARSVPGIREAAVASSGPLESGRVAWFVLPEQPRPPRGSEPHAILRAAGPAYFHTLGIRLIRGRDFTDADTAGAARVAIVNQHFARTMFHGDDPIGRRITLIASPRTVRWVNRPGDVTIVGVSDDVKLVGLNSVDFPEITLPFAQAPQPQFGIEAWIAGPSASILRELRAKAAAIDPAIPVTSSATFDQRVTEALAGDRFNLLVIAAFAVVALAMAAVGIYAAVAYAVQDRTREFGVRLALGADPSHVIVVAVMQAVRLGVGGGIAGLAGAYVVARALGSALYLVPGQHDGLLFGVRTTDPLALTSAFCGIVLVATAAGLIPARRVARIDPVVALRIE